MGEKGHKNIGKLLADLYNWVIDRLRRTVLFGIRLVIPKKLLSIHGFLGMLTLVTFIILGVTGVLLAFYYKPSITQAYTSVKLINNEVEFGIIIRNIHYHAANAMLILAIYHLFYQLFSGKYKVRNEVIWITGIITGVLTFLEAYTGYDLILNERGVLAINIGASLTNSVPIIGRTLASILLGFGFSDIILHFYIFHILVIPLLMIIILTIHLPRNLIFDPPVVAVLGGAILIAAGLYPVPLGEGFNPNIPPGITVPEWYITGLYALLRTGIDKFVAGVLLPTLFIVYFLLIPFIDKNKSMSWHDRPLITGLGIAGLAQIALTTVWGFYINPNKVIGLAERLAIDPIQFYIILAIIIAASITSSYVYSIYIHPKISQNRTSNKTVKNFKFTISERAITALVIAAIAIQVILTIYSINSYANKLYNISMISMGASLTIFGFLIHLARIFSAQEGD